MLQTYNPNKAFNQESQEDLQGQNEFLEAVIKRDPGFERAYQVIAANHRALHNWKDAARYDRQAVELIPEDPMAHVHLARDYARLGRHEEAFVELRNAVKQGYAGYDELRRDVHLESLRGDSRFLWILKDVKENFEALRRK